MHYTQTYDDAFRGAYRSLQHQARASQAAAESSAAPIATPFVRMLNAAIRAASPWRPSLSEVVVRAITVADMAFLNSLYASSRDAEVAATGWHPADQQDFLSAQFRTQHNYYREHFADGQFLLLSRGTEAIGRLYWWAQGANATLIDVTLVPLECGLGLGTSLINLLTQQADQQGQTITLHVEPHNPALRLYRRVGFEVVIDNDVYLKMHRRPKLA